ncbi:MAG TPA: reverse transcriptase domain-containing protein, partial [Acidimicrobiia bacterium]|nr:reverse transcriptase domain-containing protein [Acidimicrobiia bacterium]
MLCTPAWVVMLRRVATVEADKAEAAADIKAAKAWHDWLHEGPAAGLGRQHKMSRSATGWIPTQTAVPTTDRGEGWEDTDGISAFDLRETCRGGTAEVPLDALMVAEHEAAKWGKEWLVGHPYPALDWPADAGPPPPALTRWAVDRACRSFACGTGLGWDALHPRALLRCSDDLISLLIQIMLRCEALGEWPAAVALVVIVLLPKPDGGFRPIGLLPLLPRLWMRARREIATEWERVNKRPYLYAGEAMGAHVAVWKQAARAELAAVVGTDYALVLLDLVKAFERVPHDVVQREAKKLGYPMWLLRLSFATYRLGRVLRVGNVVSTVVVAARGITAGSGFATTELRIMMIDVVDAALKVYPTVSPTLYVDDLGMESCGGPAHILRNLVGFVTMVCRRLVEDRLELSKTKCKLTASTDKVGALVAIPLKGYGITYERRVKALGAGLGGGRRRHMGVVAARLQAFQRRGSRFRALRRAGVNTARLLRTGGTSAMCYGIAIQGVSPYMLLRQRRAASAASAPGSGLCGQNLDLALVLADGSATGRADPAYTAHSDPIGQWATAAWEQWIPPGAMLRLAAAALVKLAKARNPWHCCTGPGAGFVATAARLGWTIHDAFSVTTDDG